MSVCGPTSLLPAWLLKFELSHNVCVIQTTSNWDQKACRCLNEAGKYMHFARPCTLQLSSSRALFLGPSQGSIGLHELPAQSGLCPPFEMDPTLHDSRLICRVGLIVHTGRLTREALQTVLSFVRQELHTMRFGSTAQVLLKYKLKYYRISESSMSQGMTSALTHAAV